MLRAACWCVIAGAAFALLLQEMPLYDCPGWLGWYFLPRVVVLLGALAVLLGAAVGRRWIAAGTAGALASWAALGLNWGCGIDGREGIAVLTWNCHAEARAAAALRAHLAAHPAGIVALQEVGDPRLFVDALPGYVWLANNDERLLLGGMAHYGLLLGVERGHAERGNLRREPAFHERALTVRLYGRRLTVVHAPRGVASPRDLFVTRPQAHAQVALFADPAWRRSSLVVGDLNAPARAVRGWFPEAELGPVGACASLTFPRPFPLTGIDHVVVRDGLHLGASGTVDLAVGDHRAVHARVRGWEEERGNR